VLAALVGFALATLATSMPLVSLAAGVVVGMLPLLYVRHVARRRMAKFEEQFPEAIDLLARSLRAGHALTTALQLAAEEMPDPVGPEFQLLFDRQNYGMSLPDALREFAQRVPLLDARFFVTAVLIQRETGGNLSGVLDNLSNVIRERFTVKRQIRVLSAHGRITGWVLGMLPPIVGALLFLISPDLMSPMITDPIGNLMLAVGFGLQVIGVLIIRRIIDVEY
jgi:tight adherence protein B